MVNVGKVTAEITADDGQFNTKLSQAEGRFNQFSNKLAGPISIGVSAAAAMAAINLAIQAAEKLCDVVGPQAAMAWEAGMGNVFKTTGIDKGTESASRLNDELLQLRATMRNVTSADIQTGASILGSLGIDPGQVQSADRVILQATAAFDGLDLESSAKQLGTITNLWKDETSAVGGAASMMEKAGSSVNALGNSYSATEANILSFLNAVGGTATQYNESVAASAAIGALFETKGVSGAEAATGINTALMEGLLSRAVDSSKDLRGYKLAAQMLGLTDSGMKQKLSDDLYGTLIQIVSAVDKKGKNAAEKTEMGQALFGAYGWKYLSKLAGSQDEYAQMLAESNSAFAEGTSLQEEYTRQTDNLEGALSELGGAFEVARITAWDAGLEPATGHVEDLAQAIRNATPAIREYAAAILSGDPAQIDQAYQSMQEVLVSGIESLGPMATNALQNADWGAIGTMIGTIIGSNIGVALSLSWDGAQWLWNNSSAILGAAIDLGKGIAQGIAGSLMGSSGFASFTDAGIVAFNSLGEGAYALANAIGSGVTGAIKAAIYAFADLVEGAEGVIGWTQKKLGLSAEGSTGEKITGYKDVLTGKIETLGDYNQIILASPSQTARYVPDYTVKYGHEGVDTQAILSDLRASGVLSEMYSGGSIKAVIAEPVELKDTAGTVNVQSLIDGLSNIWTGEGYIKEPEKIAATDDSVDRLLQGYQDAAMTIAVGKSGAVGWKVADEAAEEIKARQESGESLTSMEKSIVAADDGVKKFNKTVTGATTGLQDLGKSTEESEKTGATYADSIRSLADGLMWTDKQWKNIESPTVDWFLNEQLGKVKGVFEETEWAWEKGAKATVKAAAAIDQAATDISQVTASTQQYTNYAEQPSDQFEKDMFYGSYIGPMKDYWSWLVDESGRPEEQIRTILINANTDEADEALAKLDAKAAEKKIKTVEVNDDEALATIAGIDRAASRSVTKTININVLGQGILEETSWAWDIASYGAGDAFVSRPTLAVVGDRPGGEWIGGIDQAVARFGGNGGKSVSVSISPIYNFNAPIYGVDDLNDELDRNNRDILEKVSDMIHEGQAM